jgi:hypothetical protein
VNLIKGLMKKDIEIVKGAKNIDNNKNFIKTRLF